MDPNEITQAVGSWLMHNKDTYVKEYRAHANAGRYMSADFSVTTTSEAVNELHQLINKPKMTKLTTQNDAVGAVRASSLLIGSVDAQGNFSIASNPTVQLTGTEARTEAKRLAKINPGKLFFITQLRGAEMVPVSPTISI